jgi:invasion protein IalB
MRVWSWAGSSGFVGALVLCVFAFGSGALGQTSQTRGKGTELPAQPTPAPPTWRVNCTNTKIGLDCRALQILFVKTGQRVMTVAVRLAPDTKKPEMLLALPLGAYLPAGVSLQFGNEPPKTLPIESCDPSGCLAQTVMSETELATMLKGSDVTVSLQNLKRNPVTYTVPVAGFSQVYAKIK